GVGVIFYIMMGLRRRLRELGWFKARRLAEPNLAELLDLVALGTVADVVQLDRNNRILVAQGLARMRAGQVRPGIRALCEVARRTPSRLVPSDLAFALAPRLNAAGRMEDISVGIECLLTKDDRSAMALAAQLDALNHERREVEQSMQEQAMAALAELELDERHLPYSLCLYDPDWHQGVIGILASRLKERLHRPVIAFADGGDGLIKGSARSIPGLHIRDALDSVAARHPHLIDRFGGHAMAAGLSLRQEILEAFSQAFEEVVAEALDSSDLEGVIHSDGELGEAELSLPLAEQIRYLLPWGQGVPEPLFHGDFELVERRIVGEKHLKMKLRPLQGNGIYEAIAFNITDEDWPSGTQRLRLAYRLDVNEYNGRRSLQLMVEQLEPLLPESS
ncbi:MAG: single-stranded-DNA-specific exonuclease RecJ, partial [Gammaproteobacteria bacterium]|nr:single-stranded-DNA-specific exonuclease RecJ [Gammaproteobacteria bacterium]